MAKAIKVTEHVTIEDDFDGKPLPGDTKAVKYTFGNKTYNLYLSGENHNTVNEFIKNLTDGAEVVGSKTASGGTAAAEKERKAKVVADYNKAHPGHNAARYSKTVQKWEAEQSK